jgi:hypothetical protein
MRAWMLGKSRMGRLGRAVSEGKGRGGGRGGAYSLQ